MEQIIKKKLYRLKDILRLFLCFSVFFFIFACERSSQVNINDITVQDTTYRNIAPTILSVYPKNNSNGITVNSRIIVEFSERMDGSTITPNTFTLSGGVTGTVTYSDKNAEFIPLNNLDSNTTYTVTITTEVKNIMGDLLPAEYTWIFTTGSGNAAPTNSGNSATTISSAITAPTVLSTSPANNATDITVNSEITAEFSETVDCTTFTSNTFILNGGIAGKVSCSDTIAAFMPASNLAYNTTYTATITTMTENYSWSFTTIAESVAQNRTATLTWSMPEGTNMINLAGYNIYHGTIVGMGIYDEKIPVGNNTTTYIFNNLSKGTHYFAVTAYYSIGAFEIESDPAESSGYKIIY